MATLLERIQAVLTLDDSAHGSIHFRVDDTHPRERLKREDIAEIVAALSANDSMLARANAELRSDKQRLRADLTNAIADANAAAEARDNLARTNTELSAAVAQMTSGVPVAWRVDGPGGARYFTFEAPAQELAVQRGAKVQPLFAATHTPSQAAELAAKVEAMGIELAREKRMREETRLDLVKAQDERDAWRKEAEQALARVKALTDGERLTKDALTAAEKRAAKAERGIADADTAFAAMRDEAAEAERRADAAEARVKVLEGDAEPVAWAALHGDRIQGPSVLRDLIEAEVARVGSGTVEPLYRHPPKTGEPVAWRVEYGPSDYGHTDSAERVARAKSQDAKVTPLYEAPPPAAIGVEGEQHFVAADVERCDVEALSVADADEDLHNYVGTADEARAAASRNNERGRNWAAYRLLPIDAPVVDLETVRRVIRDLGASGHANDLRAAIGDTTPARPARD